MERSTAVEMLLATLAVVATVAAAVVVVASAWQEACTLTYSCIDAAKAVATCLDTGDPIKHRDAFL